MRCCFFVEITALLPVAEVGFVDGLGGEMGGEDGLDFRQLVEPGEEVLGPLAILEALVELLTDGRLGEAGRFCRCASSRSSGAWHCFHAGQR